MEAQQYPTHGHHQYEEDTHAVIEGEGDHEKKSVLKKVKDKAKKIKNTIKKHSPGAHNNNGNDNPISEEEDDDEDDDDDDAPEVHGAPKYDSPVISGTDLPRQVDVNLEKPTDRREDRYDPNPRGPTVRDEGIPKPSALYKTEPELVKPPVVQAHIPEKQNIEEHPRVQIKPLEGLEEDPHSPKNSPTGIPPSNYQSKVADPTRTGGKEADVEPLVRRLDNLNVHDESESKPESGHSSFTSSHDQFAPQETPTKDQVTPETNPDIIDAVDPETIPRDTVAGKLPSATSAVAQRAVSAKNIVPSKLGYGGGQQIEESKSPPAATSTKPVTETAMEYAHTIGEKLAPVYGKVAGAGSAVISKMPGTGGTKQGGDDVVRETENDKGVSMKEYLAEKFKPGKEDKALSEAITDALHKKKDVPATGEGERVLGKVTESDEVAGCLGTGKENKRKGNDAILAGQESSGQGMVNRFKGVVGSWLGKSSGVETAQHSNGESYVSGSGTGSAPASSRGDAGQEKTCN